MAVRFSKRIKIAKGLSLNLSRSGVGVSMGGRGGSISVGKRGVYANTSLPGTGLSYRTKLSGGKQKPTSSGSAAAPFSGKISIQLHEDGLVTIVDEQGVALPAKLANQVKAENQEAILAMLNRVAEGNNLELEECLTIHQLTPGLRQTPEAPPAFESPKPSQPAERKISFIDKLLMRSNQIRQQNEECRNQHEEEVRAWELEKAEYERSTLAINDPDCLVMVHLCSVVYSLNRVSIISGQDHGHQLPGQAPGHANVAEVIHDAAENIPSHTHASVHL